MNPNIREGMTIFSADGEKLGKVVRCDADSFIIEKGLFFHKDYLALYEDVTDLRTDEATLSRTKDQLRMLTEEELAAPKAGKQAMTEEAARIPLKEEEIVVGKESREAGAVRVTKEVITEEKQVTVPVTHEEVRVERVPASAATPTDEKFTEEEVTIPIREERAKIGKRQVTREEVRVSKAPIEEEETMHETVRREDIKVEEQGDVRRAPGRDDDKKF